VAVLAVKLKMYGFIFNVQPQAQKILFGQPWDAFLPPLVGSFLGVFGAFVLNYVWQFWRDNHQKFVGEYHIKAELRGIKHNQEIGGKIKPIEPIYGADYVREYHLFGDNCTQVLFWYRGFEKYNSRLETLDYFEKLTSRRSMANQIDGILHTPWLKKIPDDASDLSTIKFIRYLLGRDAPEEPTKKD